jgi:hypothetical protein
MFQRGKGFRQVQVQFNLGRSIVFFQFKPQKDIAALRGKYELYAFCKNISPKHTQITYRKVRDQHIWSGAGFCRFGYLHRRSDRDRLVPLSPACGVSSKPVIRSIPVHRE